MDFETLVRTRRSVRGYKTDPVPKKIIQEIIDIAKGVVLSILYFGAIGWLGATLVAKKKAKSVADA